MMDLRTVSQASPPMLKPLLVRLRKRLDMVEDQPAEAEDGAVLEDNQHTSLSNKTVPGVTGLSSQLLERLRQEDCKFKARLDYRMN